MKSAIAVVSRSAIVTRKLCEMKRYYAYHMLHPDYDAAQAGGLTPVEEALATSGFSKVRGQLIHECLDRALQGQDWEGWLKQQPHMLPQPFGLLPEEVQKQWFVLIRRAVKGWLKVRWEGHLSEIYERVSSEEEWQWSLHPLVVQSLRMDQIWRRKRDGHLLIVDFKTLGRPDANWVDRLRNSDQTHLYIQALAERSQQPVLGMQYEGIVIGTKDRDGNHWSDFTNGYMDRSGMQYQQAYKSGWQKITTLHLRDEEWFRDYIKPAELDELFPSTPAFYPPPAQLIQTKDATVAAEVAWADKMAQLEECAADYGPDSQEYETLKGRLLERNSDACLKYGWGHACPFMSLCWDGQRPDRESFQPRVDHHVEDPA